MGRVNLITSSYPPQPDVTGGTRDGFGLGLVAAAQNHPDLIGLCADLTESTRMQAFATTYPDRFIQVGVAEQNLVGVAAGLALGGKIAVAASYAVFSPGRSWDQLRVSVCYSQLNVKIIGGHTGLGVGADGATHQALEDLALTTVLPNLTVVVPADAHQAYQATLAITDLIGPTYLRLTRIKEPATTVGLPFVLGQAQQLRSGQDVTIIACGSRVAPAVAVSDQLKTEGLSVRVLNVHTLKPLDSASIIKAAHQTQALVVAEDHQQIGGLGSLVAMTCAQQCPVPIEQVAVADTFAESGSPEELYSHYHLAPADISHAVWKVLARKPTK